MYTYCVRYIQIKTSVLKELLIKPKEELLTVGSTAKLYPRAKGRRGAVLEIPGRRQTLAGKTGSERTQRALEL